MITLDSAEFKSLIHNSASLRAQGRFNEAIANLEGSLGYMHDDCLTNVYLEIIYSARECGSGDVAKRYARRLQAIDPQIPSVKQILSGTFE